MMENMTFSGVAQAWLALACRKAVPWLLERPQHAPRSPAGTPTCIVVCLAAPLRTPQPRAREKTRGRKRKVLCSRKSQFQTYTYTIALRDVDDLKSRGCHKLTRGNTSVMSVARFTCVVPLLLLLLCRCCAAQMLLKIRGTVGWNVLFLVDMCSGWHANIIRTHELTEAPFVAVAKRVP